MIHFRCQCGLGQSVQEAVACEVTDCFRCRTPLRLVWSGRLPDDARFDARLTLRAALEDSPIAAGAQILLGGEGAVEVGKDEGKAICLPAKAVSRSHCRLTPTAAGWRVDDLGSTNGCFVNGERVDTRLLADGDVLRVGFYELAYFARATGGAAAEARPAPPKEFEPGAPEAPPRTPPRPAPVAPPRPIAARPAGVARAPSKPPPVPADDVPEWRVGEVYAAEPGERRAPRRTDGHTPAHRPPPAPAGPPVVCPSCTRKLPPGTKVCVACGIHTDSGRPLIIARELDEQKLEAGTHEILQFVSVILWLGFCPIASEAYGSKRPYTVWAIALLTAVTSVAVWVHDRGEEPALRDTLAHWIGTLTSAHVREQYEHPDADGPAKAAYESMKEARRGTVPDEQLPLAAYNALPPEHQVLGRSRWYQPFTHTLVHADVLHLAGNLLFLLVFGSRVNALLGQWKTALLYPLLGALSGWAEAWARAADPPTPGIGASGAVAGLAGMYLVLFPVHRVHSVAWVRGGLFTVMYKIFAVRGFWVVVAFFAWDGLMLLASADDGVAHWAHLGGLAGGIVAAVLLLVARAADARGGDLISVALGRRAWGLLGRPARRQPAPATSP